MEPINQFLMAFLLNAAWQILLITIIAFFCDWLLVRQTTARVRHWLWVTALILSFCLPVFNSLNYLNNSLFSPQTAQIIEAPDLVNTAAPPALTVSNPGEINSVIPIDQTLSIFLFILYLLFLAYRSVKLFRAWKQTQFVKNTTISTKPSDLVLEISEECRKALGMNKVRILYSSAVTSPITVGAFEPLIILPEQLADESGRDILRSAIGHELVHIRRSDYLLNLLYEIICLPLSFHPVTKLLKRRIKETRELSCDELVTDKLLTPKAYARSLVQLAGSAMDLGRRTIMTIGINDADILENRIMKILKRPKINIYRRNFLLALAILFFAGVFVVTSTFTLRPIIAQQTPERDKVILEEKRKAEKDSRLIEEKIKAEQDAQIQERKLTEQEKKDIEQRISERKQAEDEVKRKIEEQVVAESQAELAKHVKITMAQALEIAAKEQKGVIVECRLVFAKANEAYYSVRIVYDQGAEKVETRLLINATDGNVTMNNKYPR